MVARAGRRTSKISSEPPSTGFSVQLTKKLPAFIQCGICGTSCPSPEVSLQHMRRHFLARSPHCSVASSLSSKASTTLAPNSAEQHQPSSYTKTLGDFSRMSIVAKKRVPLYRAQTAFTGRLTISPRRPKLGPDPATQSLLRPLSEPSGERKEQDKQNARKDSARVAKETDAVQELQAVNMSSDFSASAKTYSCFLCQAEFTDPTSLLRHGSVHGGRAPYSCTRCGRMLALYSSLLKHERTHCQPDAGGDDSAYPCPRCPAVFLHQASLKAHARRHDREAALRQEGPAAKPYQCTACQEWLSNEGTLRIHTRRHDSDDRGVCLGSDNEEGSAATPRGGSVRCPRCGTGFSSGTFLRAHRKLHDAEVSTRCIICVRRFRRSRVVLRHSDVHADERQDVCDTCERRFPKVESGGPGAGSWRRLRLLGPEAEKEEWRGRFHCLYCPAAFPRLRLLAAHEVGHTDLRAEGSGSGSGSGPAAVWSQLPFSPDLSSSPSVHSVPEPPLLPPHLRRPTIVVN